MAWLALLPADSTACARPPGRAPTPRALYHPRDSTNNLQPPPEKHRLMHLGMHCCASAHPPTRQPSGLRDRRQKRPRGPFKTPWSKRLSQQGGQKRYPARLKSTKPQ